MDPLSTALLIGGGYGLWKFLTSSSKPSATHNQNSKVVSTSLIDDAVEKLLKETDSFFSNLLEYPLTKEQRIAILDSRKSNLVLASAGCGKTSVLIAKYAYLSKYCNVPSKNILLLAFNKSVKEELIERLDNLGVQDANVHTFHSFGRLVLDTQDDPTRLSKYAEEDKSGIVATDLIKNLLRDVSHKDISIVTDFIELRALSRYAHVETFAKDLDDYYAKIAAYPYKRDKYKFVKGDESPKIPTLDKEVQVRSQQELLIANWFIINGINFEYEKKFIGSDFDYSPDFFIPEADLWIEHFAINRDGQSPFKGYKDETEKKIEFHKSKNSNFECTYSYEYNEDIIIEKLEGILKKNHIQKKPLSNKEIQELLDELEVDSFFQFLAEMMRLIKSLNFTNQEIQTKLSSLKDQFRANRFLRIIIPLMREYTLFLEKNKEIDFEDMIIKAYESIYTKSSKARDNFTYSYLLVDEFQDLSKGRYELLSALKEMDDSELYGVGDDWQSINRFAGADISNTLDFKENFKENIYSSSANDEADDDISSIQAKNPVEVFSVTQTHRCSKNIAKLASEFIQNNPDQWKKDIVSKQTINSEIKFVEIDEYSSKFLLRVLKEIPVDEKRKKVAIIYPYHYLSSKINFKELQDNFPKLKIGHNSIHQFKGLEADHVIVIGLDSGQFGFPRLWNDDPLRNVFLPESDKFQYAEERRVFYVAMTRAKESLYICHKFKQNPSPFFTEALDIAKNKYIPYKLIKISDEEHIIGRCPRCEEVGKRGLLKVKTKKPQQNGGRNKYSVFAGCTLFHPEKKGTYDFCDFIHPTRDVPCPKCEQEGKLGSSLYISFSDERPKVRVECFSCDKVLNYFDLHS